MIADKQEWWDWQPPTPSANLTEAELRGIVLGVLQQWNAANCHYDGAPLYAGDVTDLAQDIAAAVMMVLRQRA